MNRTIEIPDGDFCAPDADDSILCPCLDAAIGFCQLYTIDVSTGYNSPTVKTQIAASGILKCEKCMQGGEE